MAFSLKSNVMMQFLHAVFIYFGYHLYTPGGIRSHDPYYHMQKFHANVKDQAAVGKPYTRRFRV
jgi:hypothetical protein